MSDRPAAPAQLTALGDPSDEAASDRPPGTACRKSSTPVNNFDTRSDWAALVSRAAAQHGAITARQLADLGASRAAISSYASSGHLHRIHQGVYALTPRQLLTPNGRLMAAVLACGPLAALSFQPAARLHGLLNHRTAQPHVTVPTSNGRSRPGIRVHRSTTLRPNHDITIVESIPATSVHRTIFDLAGVLTARQLERLLDQALTRDLLDMYALNEQIAQNAGRPKNRTALELILASHTVGSTPTWNDFEERFFQIIRAAGLPQPEVQPWLDLHDGELPIQPDFLWRQQRVIVETDGWGTHGGRTSFERDRRRDQRAAAAGFQTVRVTWRQMTDETPRLQAMLLAVVSTAASAATAPVRTAEAA
jgi:hypothetical protein